MEEYITPEQAAARVQVKVSLVWTQIEKNRIRVLRAQTGTLISEKDFADWLVNLPAPTALIAGDITKMTRIEFSHDCNTEKCAMARPENYREDPRLLRAVLRAAMELKLSWRILRKLGQSDQVRFINNGGLNSEGL